MFELNIIIILLLLHTLLYMVGPKKSTILACGLFGYIGQRGNHNFSWDKFNVLGMDNDERGGDSVGRAIGDVISKYVNKKKAQTTYKDFVINNKNSDPSHIAIGHTRKASVGVVNEENAQPIVIDIPNGGKFIMVHNGTIYNWMDLAKKYNREWIGKTDSMVLAEIIFNHGYDVLLEYEGAAAIIIRDDRDPGCIKVFKGASKGFNSVISEERPLSYYQESENSMYISSRAEGLYFIGGDGTNVDEFDSNVLYTIEDGKIISQLQYDRSNCSSVKSNVVTTTFSTYKRVDDDDFDDYGSWYNRKYPTGGAFTDTSRIYNIRKDYILNPIFKNQIVAARLRYYFFDNHNTEYFANGSINLSEEGIRNDGAKNIGDQTYYFYRGIMIKDKTSYCDVLKIFGKSKRFIDSDENISKLCKYSVHPIATIENALPAYSNVREWKEVWNNSVGKYEFRSSLLTGQYRMLFGKKTYTFKHGDQTDLKMDGYILRAIHTKVETPVITLPAVMTNKNTVVKGFTPNTVIKEFTTRNSAETVNDVFYEDEEDRSTTEFLEAALSDGITSMLFALGETITAIEEMGIGGDLVTRILSNLYMLQDPLLESDRIKTEQLTCSFNEEF